MCSPCGSPRATRARPGLRGRSPWPSPIDLIPDAIPLLGYLDDVVLVPLGILLAIRLVPPAVMAECRARAEASPRPVSRAGAVIIVILWILAAGLVIHWVWPAG